MSTMGLVLTYLGTLACMLCILDYVASSGNSAEEHSPSDHCHHSLSRAPDEGYDSCKQSNYEPISFKKKENKKIIRTTKKPTTTKKPHPPYELDPEDKDIIFNGGFSKDVTKQLQDVRDLRNKIKKTLFSAVKNEPYDGKTKTLKDLLSVARIINAVKTSGNITAEEKKQFTADFIKKFKNFQFHFNDVFQFAAKPNVKNAYNLILHELKDDNWIKGRSGGHQHN